jgi:hypothetical protein
MNNEEFIKVLSESTKIKIPPSIEDAFGKQLDFEDAFQAEVSDNDRFIALDFRTVDAPPFDIWVTDNRNFRKGVHQKGDIEYDYFDFDWNLVNDRLFVTAKVIILDNYDCVHDVLSSHTADIAPSLSPSQMSHFWKPCKKSIGTDCSRTAITTFFVYKNVFVKVRAVPILPKHNPLRDILSDWTDEILIPKSPNEDPWDMAIAEWIYDILKTAPCFKVFPSEPKPG